MSIVLTSTTPALFVYFFGACVLWSYSLILDVLNPFPIPPPLFKVPRRYVIDMLLPDDHGTCNTISSAISE